MVGEKILNILVISSYYHPAAIYGGPVPVMRNLNRALIRIGHRVTTYTTDANGSGDLQVPRGQPLMVDGLPVRYFPRWWFGRGKKPSNIFFSPEMGKRLREIKPGDYDLILIHSSFCDPGRMAAKVAKRIGIPYIYYTHGGFEPWALKQKFWKKRLYYYLVEKRILQGAAGVVVCNAAEAKQLQSLGINTLTRRIPWGVDLPDLGHLPFRERLRELFPTLSNRPFILFLSRLHPKKGLDLLIPAFGTLAREFPDWRLVLAGPDEAGYQTHLERLISNLGLEQRILFTGLVSGEDKAALLRQAEFLVLPSYSEGFPVVVAEALGYGRPVVITTTCYVPEVAEKEAGIVVPPEINSLTNALREMMRDEGLRLSCSQNALSLAQGHFTWEAVAERTMAFFQEVIERKNKVNL